MESTGDQIQIKSLQGAQGYAAMPSWPHEVAGKGADFLSANEYIPLSSEGPSIGDALLIKPVMKCPDRRRQFWLERTVLCAFGARGQMSGISLIWYELCY